MAEKATSYFRCWFGSDENEEEVKRLKSELEETRSKLQNARKELMDLENENEHLKQQINATTPNLLHINTSDKSNLSLNNNSV